jgi:F-type H+-transporting ATPase subunit gamma
MANLKDIRVRIDSTKNTQQITKAMKLVSAAKLRKAQNQIVTMRPYANSLLKVIGNIVLSNRASHPLIEKREQVKRVLLIVLTSDRGLCGGFNTNICRFSEAYLKTHKEKYEVLDTMFIGRRGLDYFARRGIKPVESIIKLDRDISYALAAKVATKAMDQYLDGSYDEIRLVYNEFKSAISQKVTTETLLPIDLEKAGVRAEDFSDAGFSADLIFEPTPELPRVLRPNTARACQPWRARRTMRKKSCRD